MTKGVLVFEGMKVGVLPGDLTVELDESGATSAKLVLSTAYNVLPLWLRRANTQMMRVTSYKPTFGELVCCRSTRLRRSHDLIKRERAVQLMRVGPSGSVFRSRSQPPSKLLRSRAVVVSVGGKARGKLVQVSIRETNESEPIEDASLRSQVSSKPGA